MCECVSSSPLLSVPPLSPSSLCPSSLSFLPPPLPLSTSLLSLSPLFFLSDPFLSFSPIPFCLSLSSSHMLFGLYLQHFGERERETSHQNERTGEIRGCKVKQPTILQSPAPLQGHARVRSTPTPVRSCLTLVLVVSQQAKRDQKHR